MFCGGIIIKSGNNNRLCIEQGTDPVANKIINSLHVQFFCKAFLHTVYHTQFCFLLFGFFQQAGGFIKQAGIFKGYTHTVGQCFQQPHIRITDSIFSVNILNADIAGNFISNN